MYIESREHIPGMSLGSGLRMDIHPFKTMPFLWRTGLSVPSGAQTYVGLTMVQPLYLFHTVKFAPPAISNLSIIETM